MASQSRQALVEQMKAQLARLELEEALEEALEESDEDEELRVEEDVEATRQFHQAMQGLPLESKDTIYTMLDRSGFLLSASKAPAASSAPAAPAALALQAPSSAPSAPAGQALQETVPTAVPESVQEAVTPLVAKMQSLVDSIEEVLVEGKSISEPSACHQPPSSSTDSWSHSNR